MMKHTLCNRIAGTVLAIAFPIAGLADVAGSVTLTATNSLDLETGTTAASGGDLLWDGIYLSPQGSARASIFPYGSAAGYTSLTQSDLVSLGYRSIGAPIATSQLTTGTVLQVFDNVGRPAKLLVTSNGRGSLALQFTTFGATLGGVAGGPTITKIQNNSSNVPEGFPNYGIAPSSLFIVGGSGLSDQADAILQDTTIGLPLTLNGASISVTVNGVTQQCALYYAIPTQLAAVLPASTPVGTGTLTVTHIGVASAPVAIQIVAAAVGINNYNSGLAVAQDPVSPTGAIFAFTNSAAVETVMTLWSTGLGANTGISDTAFTGGAHPVNTPLQIYIGGVLATNIPYQGSSGYPGVNIVNVSIPQGAPLGCHVPVLILTGSIVSNSVTVPIAAAKGGVCSDSLYGITGDQLSNLSGKTTVKTGSVAVLQSTSPGTSGAPSVSSQARAFFQQISGPSFSSSSGSISLNGCFLSQTLTGVGSPSVTGLDAGTITLSGAFDGPTTMSRYDKGIYSSGFGSALAPGSLVFKGSGGADVSAFTTTVNFPTPLLGWTNQSAAATVARSQGLSVSWTGGSPGTYVTISGTSSNGILGGSFMCAAPVATQQFTVPSYILLALPAGTGSTVVENSSTPSSFSTSGIDAGHALGTVSYSVNSNYN